jgi:hypothetical protein
MTDQGNDRLGSVSARHRKERADNVALAARRPGRWRAWSLLVIAVWAALAAANVALLAVRSSAPPARATRSAAGPRVARTANSPSASVPPSPSSSPVPEAQALAPVAAAAFGPTGTGTGDDPGNAYEAIDASAATAWLTAWYRSAAFGDLQPGTGLLIDMGQPVTVTSIRIILGSTPGADLEILTGNAPVRSQMLLQGSVSNAGGSVSMNLARHEQARYVLIWFTLLPPDTAGTFQASVYDVTLAGTA